MASAGGAPALPNARYVRGESDIFAYLHSVLAKRIMILDGAMGTMIQTHKLGEAECVAYVLCKDSNTGGQWCLTTGAS